jgi:hypothetical protein
VSRIAPKLQHFFRPMERAMTAHQRAMQRELRALLAVARAARDYRDGHSCSEAECPIATALYRALSRLSRASDAKGGK